MNRFAVFTFTRAEYGLYRPILHKLFKSKEIECKLYAGGMHLLQDFGNSIDEIEADSFPIADTIDFVKKDEVNCFDLLGSVAGETEKLQSIFKSQQFDYLLVLGDRWELIPLVYMAMLSNIPVIHLGGGENTIGVIDNQIRHAATKMSHFHVVANKQYAANISRMGEEDWRIAIAGAPGLENIKNVPMASYKEIVKHFDLEENKPYFLMTYHPETGFDERSNITSLEKVLSIVEEAGIPVVITYPNLETDSDLLIQTLKNRCKGNKQLKLYSNLGMKLYLSTMKYAAAVIGNSSSGITEAPFLRIPTINIGNRQKGRLLASSIVQVDDIDKEFGDAIKKVLYDKKFNEQLSAIESYYGDGNCSEIIVKVLENISKISRKQLLEKKFDTQLLEEKWNSLC